MSATTRKAPEAKTLRQLYMLSGNLCARPKCNTVLINANGTLVGEVCHIKAEKPDGARYDKNLSEKERRSAGNLILLCNVCHKLVDSEPEKYTVAVLTKWKREREARFAAVGDTLRQRYLDEIQDEAQISDSTLPKSLKTYVKYLDGENYTHRIDHMTIQTTVEYVERLRHLSLPDRNLMRAIVEKSLALGGSRSSEYGISVHPDDLKTILINNGRLSDWRIKNFGKTLERNDLGYLDADEEPQLSIRAPDEDLDWVTLKAFMEARGRDLSDLICDLKFSL